MVFSGGEDLLTDPRRAVFGIPMNVTISPARTEAREAFAREYWPGDLARARSQWIESHVSLEFLRDTRPRFERRAGLAHRPPHAAAVRDPQERPRAVSRPRASCPGGLRGCRGVRSIQPGTAASRLCGHGARDPVGVRSLRRDRIDRGDCINRINGGDRGGGSGGAAAIARARVRREAGRLQGMEGARAVERLGHADRRATARWTPDAGHLRRSRLSLRERPVEGPGPFARGFRRAAQVVQLRRRQALADARRQRQRAAMGERGGIGARQRRVFVRGDLARRDVRRADGQSAGSAGRPRIHPRDRHRSRHARDPLQRDHEERHGLPAALVGAVRFAIQRGGSGESRQTTTTISGASRPRTRGACI